MKSPPRQAGFPLLSFAAAWPIRRKLFAAFLAVFAVTFILSWAASAWLLERIVHRQVEAELENTTKALENLLEASIDASIASYLRGIAEKNTELVASLYAQVQAGKLESAEAKRRAAEILLAQKIGESGYIYVLDSQGIIRVHPKAELDGADLTRHAFIREQLKQRSGYLEYQWANPGEAQARPKALYMSYFAPWDWIISVSSYRDEFRRLVNTSDFRSRILEQRFGDTGYSYLIDMQGELLIHPTMEGKNILEAQDSQGRKFIRELLAKKNGRIIYPWQNPEEAVAREKLVVFHHIPEMDWVVASSSYLEEFTRAGDRLAWIMAGTLLLSLAMAGAATLIIGRMLTQPLIDLTTRVSRAGDGAAQPVEATGDEVATLATTIDGFLARIQRSQHGLEQSELRYRTLFENALEGIFQSTRDGRLVAANPSLAQMLGYGSREELMTEVGNIGNRLYADPRVREDLWRQVESSNAVRGFQAELRKLNGDPLWVMINARAVRQGGRIDYLEGFLTDVTEEKRQREALLEQQKELETRVEERTRELRLGIERLERHNAGMADLHAFSAMLLLCPGLPESVPIIEAFLPRFFPRSAAALFLADSETGRLLPSVTGSAEGFDAQACCALRAGKPYAHAAAADLPRCAHLDPGAPVDSLCLPVIAGGEVHGLILVLGREAIDEEAQRQGTNMVDHLALAITTLKLQARLREQSIRDPLTGLYNRRYLDEVTPRELHNAHRLGQAVSVVLFDIDHFKRFNDQYGHDTGDAVLRQLTRFIVARLRATDLAFRVGGEEFLLLLPNTDAQSAHGKMEKLRRQVENELRVKQQELHLAVTISIGIADFPSQGKNIDELMKAADAAMYRAKSEGRNRVRVAEVCTDLEQRAQGAQGEEGAAQPLPATPLQHG